MSRARENLDPYHFIRLIRAGQICQVWEAAHIEQGQRKDRVAIKILREDERKNQNEIALLKHEFEVASKFDHKNVIKVIEFSRKRFRPFLVIELFNSQNLKQALRDGPDFLAPDLHKIVEQMTEGLFYMHQQGWLHCDVKPDNFLLNTEKQIKLIDFAIAQRPTSGLGKLFGGKSKVRGTRSYMSPEQIRGKAIDVRADIYGLGCVLYELATGRLPFTGENPNDLLSKHLSAPVPSASAANSNLTPELTELLKKMMAKDREQRPTTLWDFLREFRAIRLFRSAPKRPDEKNDKDSEA